MLSQYQIYAVIVLELRLVETGKESFSIDCTVSCRFICSGIHRLYLFIAFFWCSFLEAPLSTTIVIIICMCSREIFLASLNSSIFFYSFYHAPPICLESDIIWFGASASLRLTFVDSGKYVLSYNLHVMGVIYKEGWLLYLLLKFFFWWIQNLNLGTFVWMLDQNPHCAIIVSDDDINDKKLII